MDLEKARRKEARRTLKRIRGTLRQLEDGSASKDPINRDEFRWMKQLVEQGFDHPPAHPWRLLLQRLWPWLLLVAGLGLAYLLSA